MPKHIYNRTKNNTQPKKTTKKNENTATLADIIKAALQYPFQHPIRFLIGFLLLGAVFSYLFRNNSQKSPCAEFEIVDGKYTPETTLVLLGEYHPRSEWTKACIEQLTKNNAEQDHIVFLETVPLGQEVACEEYTIPNKPNRKCVGWDDKASSQQADKEIRDNIYMVMIQTIFKKYNDSKKNVDYIDSMLKHLEEKAESLLRPLEQKYNPNAEANYVRQYFTNEETEYVTLDCTHKAYSEIIEMRNKGLSYQTIFQQLSKVLQADPSKFSINFGRTYDPNDENFAEYLAKRNRQLMESYKLYPGFFKIVRAGLHHVVPTGFNTLSDKKAIEPLLSDLQNNQQERPYAILGMTKK